MKSRIEALSIPYARLVIFVMPKLPVAMGSQLADRMRSEFRAVKTTARLRYFSSSYRKTAERVMSVGTAAGSRDERWSGRWSRTERKKCSTS
jgi:hypothetical protein